MHTLSVDWQAFWVQMGGAMSNIGGDQISCITNPFFILQIVSFRVHYTLVQVVLRIHDAQFNQMVVYLCSSGH